MTRRWGRPRGADGVVMAGDRRSGDGVRQIAGERGAVGRRLEPDHRVDRERRQPLGLAGPAAGRIAGRCAPPARSRSWPRGDRVRADQRRPVQGTQATGRRRPAPSGARSGRPAAFRRRLDELVLLARGIRFFPAAATRRRPPASRRRRCDSSASRRARSGRRAPRSAAPGSSMTATSSEFPPPYALTKYFVNRVGARGFGRAAQRSRPTPAPRTSHDSPDLHKVATSAGATLKRSDSGSSTVAAAGARPAAGRARRPAPRHLSPAARASSGSRRVLNGCRVLASALRIEHATAKMPVTASAAR